MSQHLSSAQVAELLDERLGPGDRNEVVLHLSTCADCRHEIAELHGALSHVDVPRSRVRWLAAVLAAAGVVAIIAVPQVAPYPGTSPGRPSTTRATESSPVQLAAQIRVVEPSDGGLVSRAAVFTWRGTGPDASYLLTVQDAAGTVIWTMPLADTSAVLPPSVKLAPGAHYFWSVDARLVDGSSSRSGAHSFIAR
jgi:hypothetical protein